MKRLAYTLLFYLAMCCRLAHAGQVILTLPDEQLRGVIDEACVFVHCESPDNGGYKTDQEKADWVLEHELKAAINAIIALKTQGKIKDLDALQGSLAIRYDQP